MKTSEVFRAAKKHLWTGVGRRGIKAQFVCQALNRSWARGYVTFGDARLAEKIIDKLLGRHCALEDWLIAKGGVPFNYLYSPRSEKRRNRQKLQATRHAWLDHLIQHYESIGD